MSFPEERPRRLRRTERLRAMVRETRVTPEHLVYPLFVTPGTGVRKEISSLPGCFHLSVDEAAREAEEVERLGIGGVILFGLPSSKDPVGSEGYADDGVVQEATRAIRAACQELLVITDVCLCEYTSHGHCGVIEDGEVKNDPTLELLAPPGGLPRPGRRPRGRPLGHDGRPGGGHPRRPSTRPATPSCRSSPTPPSTPRPSTAPSARPRIPPPSSGTGAGTRWTPPTCARRCARCGSTSRRGRTW